MSGGPARSTTVRLAASGGRSDVIRIALTAVGSALGCVALLCGATVAFTGPHDGPYASQLLQQSGLHPGVVIAFVLLCVPVLGFVGQCSRVGAPARDRRLATFRMAGATPGDVARIVAAETALAAGVGAVLGLGVYACGRALIGGRVIGTYTATTTTQLSPGILARSVQTRTGPILRLPTDVLPPGWLLAMIVVAIPAGAVLFSQLALRTVAFNPTSVTHRATPRTPRLLPIVLFGVGITGLAAFTAIARVSGLDHRNTPVRVLVILALFIATGIGLTTGAATIAARSGAYLADRASRPALLIAGRRLAAQPFQASRSNAVLLLVVVITGAVQGVRPAILTQANPTDRSFYAGALNLVNLALALGITLGAASILVTAAEGVVARRRDLALLTATGTPQSTLRRAVMIETLLPLAPTALLAAFAGVLAARGVYGSQFQTSAHDNLGNANATTVTDVPLPFPWLATLAIPAATLLVVTVLTSTTLLLLRRSTDIAELRAPA